VEHEPKLLLFSRFKSTPQSIAALTSLRVEARYLSRGRYPKAWKPRRLQPAPNRHPILALFHPSPFLIGATDPLAFAGNGSGWARETVRKQLAKAIKAMDVEVVKGPGKNGARHKPLWILLSALERMAGHASLTKAAWKVVAANDTRLSKLVNDWHQERRLDWISRREFEDLVTAALSSPGVVTGRALLRHFPDALAPEHFAEIVGLAWHGLRLYLDKPVFWARLPKGKPVRVMQQACLDGNLEAVLDEHFWMRCPSLPTRERGLANNLREALGVSTGGFLMHSVNKERLPKFHVRCHAAVPFGSTEKEDNPTHSSAAKQLSNRRAARKSNRRALMKSATRSILLSGRMCWQPLRLGRKGSIFTRGAAGFCIGISVRVPSNSNNERDEYSASRGWPCGDAFSNWSGMAFKHRLLQRCTALFGSTSRCSRARSISIAPASRHGGSWKVQPLAASSLICPRAATWKNSNF
jgi:hypothetical protein